MYVATNTTYYAATIQAGVINAHVELAVDARAHAANKTS